jgi:short-subunit dehydrogenase
VHGPVRARRLTYWRLQTVFVVVTGASDGIGAEFAVQLADAGFNIVLVARSHEKLSEIASRIADRAFFELVIPSCLDPNLS